MEGWIKLHRKLSDNPLWTCEKFTKGQAWVDLLMLANHAYNYFYVRGNKIEVKRGQVGWSGLKLATRWKWSRNKVKNFLNQLEKEQQITQQKSKLYSVITIINYNQYQNKEQQTTQQKSNRRATEEQQKDINKNEKNKKNEEKYNNYGELKECVDYYGSFLERSVLKKNFEKQYDKAIECCDKLIRIDGYTLIEIKRSIYLAMNHRGNDGFSWSDQFQSFSKLRTKNVKAGVNHIVIFASLKNNNIHKTAHRPGSITETKSREDQIKVLEKKIKSFGDMRDLDPPGKKKIIELLAKLKELEGD